MEQLTQIFEKELKALQKSADAAAEAATHSENKPENKYDTRSLEASYLAGAQRARAGEIIAAIKLLETMAMRNFTDEDRIAATALVEVDDEGRRAFYFLMIVGAGHQLALEASPSHAPSFRAERGIPRSAQDDETLVTVISPQSPIGHALMGKGVGDLATVKTSQGSKDYEIVSIR